MDRSLHWMGSFFEDDELMILAKLLYILCYLEDIDKKVSAKFQLQ